MLFPAVCATSSLLFATILLQLGANVQPKRAGERLDPRKQTDFAVALARDAGDNLWLGTEDAGVWRRDATGQWQQFTIKDGLGDNNAYALAVDRQNRVWAATLNHGVSIWNGKAWKTYGK